MRNSMFLTVQRAEMLNEHEHQENEHQNYMELLRSHPQHVAFLRNISGILMNEKDRKRNIKATLKRKETRNTRCVEIGERFPQISNFVPISTAVATE